MNNRRVYLLLLMVAAFSLTVLPTAAAAMPADLSEYMARLAACRLYVPYYELESDPSPAESAYGKEEEPPVSAAEPPQKAEESIPSDGIAVGAFNLCRYEEGDEPQLLIMNETSYKAYPRSAADTLLTVGGGAVLIMHTHGTEAYLPDGVGYYKEGEDFRSRSEEETVVAVGEVFAECLRKAGIEVYHDRTMYDRESFENAYTAARNAAKRHMAEKPQIRYIIDIHRDAVTDGSGTVCKTLCRVDGKESAQIMLVVGTDEAGASHAGWRNNFCVAAKYQRLLNKYPTLARPIYLRKASYNQQLCTGGMLLEIGSAGNTVTEAKTAARYAAECFVELYNSL